MAENNFKSILNNLLALAFGCLVALVLLEMGLHLLNPIQSRLRGDMLVLPANRKYILDNYEIEGLDKKIIHTKNSIGFRGPEIPPGGLKEVLGIIAVGGSTTECFYTSDGKDWPALLLDQLKRDFDRVWLNNGGLNGHSTFGHSILMKDHIIKLNPSIVLFLVGANDVGRLDIEEYVTSHLKGMRFDSIKGFVKSASAYSEVANLSLNLYRYYRAKLAGLGHNSLDITRKKQLDYPDSQLSEMLDYHVKTFIPSYEQRLLNLIRITRENSIDAVLITHPALYGEGIDKTTGVDLAGIRSHNVPGHTRWRTLELYNDVTRRIGREENILVIDLANELEKDSRYFYDFHHYTNAGSRVVAAIIHRHLKPYLLENYRLFSKTSQERKVVSADSGTARPIGSSERDTRIPKALWSGDSDR